MEEKRKRIKARRKTLNAALRKMEQQRCEIEQDREQYKALLERRDRLEKTKGRPGTWKGEAGGELYAAVEATKKANEKLGRKQSIAGILHELRNDLPLNELLKGRDANALKARYSETKRYWAPRFKELQEIEAKFAALEARANARGPVMTSDEVSSLINPHRKNVTKMDGDFS
jgi:hypothetical protein